MRALADLGFEDVVSLNSVGSLKKDLPPGTFVSCADYVGLQQGPGDLLRSRIERRRAPIIANNLIPKLVAELAPEFKIHTGKVYVQMRGPRFETKARDRIVQHWGDVIGMTAAHEADLCTELGLRYNSLALIDNYANGLEGHRDRFREIQGPREIEPRSASTGCSRGCWRFWPDGAQIARLTGEKRVCAARRVSLVSGPMSDFVQAGQITEAKDALERLRANMRVTIKGKDEVVEQVLVCLVAGGHLLIEESAGRRQDDARLFVGRARWDCAFSRIQFTSDLLPSDVTGVAIYDETIKEFVFKKGPVFANVVLADEINRATPKTAVRAARSDGSRARVTVDGEAHAVGSPFMVFATQNPVDYEGTFPLPESQMDRFLMRLQMGYPLAADELEILRTQRGGYDAIRAESGGDARRRPQTPDARAPRCSWRRVCWSSS